MVSPHIHGLNAFFYLSLVIWAGDMKKKTVTALLKLVGQFGPRWVLILVVAGVLSYQAPQIVHEFFVGVREFMARMSSCEIFDDNKDSKAKGSLIPSKNSLIQHTRAMTNPTRQDAGAQLCANSQ
jgi:hypothetical protein